MGHYSRSSSRQNDWTDKLHHLGRDIKKTKHSNRNINSFNEWQWQNKNASVENLLIFPNFIEKLESEMCFDVLSYNNTIFNVFWN